MKETDRHRESPDDRRRATQKRTETLHPAQRRRVTL